MAARGQFLINKSGVRVHVAIERVEVLLAQGFRLPDEVDEQKRAEEEIEQFIDKLAQMTKAELVEYALAEFDAELDGGLKKADLISAVLELDPRTGGKASS